jgi:hypothetical protein
LRSDDAKVVFDVMRYLTDRVHGRPRPWPASQTSRSRSCWKRFRWTGNHAQYWTSLTRDTLFSRSRSRFRCSDSKECDARSPRRESLRIRLDWVGNKPIHF